MNDKTYTGKEMFEHRLPSEYIVPPPGSETQGQALDRMQREVLARGPMVSGGVPKPGEEIQESIRDLLATEPFRRENETIGQIVARTGLYLEFRVWPRERIAAHIAEIERQARDYPEPKLAPNCI